MHTHIFTFINEENLQMKTDVFVLFVLIFTQGIKSWLLQDTVNIQLLRI